MCWQWKYMTEPYLWNWVQTGFRELASYWNAFLLFYSEVMLKLYKKKKHIIWNALNIFFVCRLDSNLKKMSFITTWLKATKVVYCCKQWMVYYIWGTAVQNLRIWFQKSKDKLAQDGQKIHSYRSEWWRCRWRGRWLWRFRLPSVPLVLCSSWIPRSEFRNRCTGRERLIRTRLIRSST